MSSAPDKWGLLSFLVIGTNVLSVLLSFVSIRLTQRVETLETRARGLRSDLSQLNVDVNHSRNFLRNWHLTDQRIRVLENLEKMKQEQSFETDELESSSTDES